MLYFLPMLFHCNHSSGSVSYGAQATRLQRASRFACFYALCFIILHMLQEHFRSLMCFATAQASKRSQLLTFSTPQGLSCVPHPAFNLLQF